MSKCQMSKFKFHLHLYQIKYRFFKGKEQPFILDEAGSSVSGYFDESDIKFSIDEIIFKRKFRDFDSH